jgi:hypothetical protein
VAKKRAISWRPSHVYRHELGQYCPVLLVERPTLGKVPQDSQPWILAASKCFLGFFR